MKLSQQIKTQVLAPIQAMQWRYLPLLMVFFAYGFSGFSSIAETFWVKQHLHLTSDQLISIGIWAGMPWTIKMLFGQFVDSIPIFGNQRKSYICIGAVFMTMGILVMTGMAGQHEWVKVLGGEYNQMLLASTLLALGCVIQNVVAEAMSVDVVDHYLPNGEPKDPVILKQDISMVQVLGRLSLVISAFLAAGLAGWLTTHATFEHIFWLRIIIPMISVIGIFLSPCSVVEPHPINKPIMFGGLGYLGFSICMAFSNFVYSQEIIFAVSLCVITYMLRHVCQPLDAKNKKNILFACIVIFIFRATPGYGPGVGWWQIDQLGFDPSFYATLTQIGQGLALVGMWMLAEQVSKQHIGKVLFWLTVIGSVLSLPDIGMAYGLHHWTQAHLGFGARTIAIVNTTVGGPFADLSMIPLFALVAYYSPRGNTATFFAIMTSLMNMALMAGDLLTKQLNHMFVIERGHYEQVAHIVVASNIISFIFPVITILIFMNPWGSKSLTLSE